MTSVQCEWALQVFKQVEHNSCGLSCLKPYFWLEIFIQDVMKHPEMQKKKKKKKKKKNGKDRKKLVRKNTQADGNEHSRVALKPRTEENSAQSSQKVKRQHPSSHLWYAEAELWPCLNDIKFKLAQFNFLFRNLFLSLKLLFWHYLCSCVFLLCMCSAPEEKNGGLGLHFSPFCFSHEWTVHKNLLKENFFHRWNIFKWPHKTSMFHLLKIGGSARFEIQKKTYWQQECLNFLSWHSIQQAASHDSVPPNISCSFVLFSASRARHLKISCSFKEENCSTSAFTAERKFRFLWSLNLCCLDWSHGWSLIVTPAVCCVDGLPVRWELKEHQLVWHFTEKGKLFPKWRKTLQCFFVEKCFYVEKQKNNLDVCFHMLFAGKARKILVWKMESVNDTLQSLNVSTNFGGNATNSTELQGPSPSDFVQYKIGLHLALYVLPMVILLGTIGNVFTFVVLVRKRMRNTSVNVYLLLLSCADTGALYFSGFKTWLRLITNFELLHTSNAGCKCLMFVFLVSLHMSAWLVVAISADRFTAVWFPLRSLTVCNVRRAQIVSIIGFIIISMYNAHVFWTMHLLLKRNGHYSCSPLPTDRFMMDYYPWIKLTTYSCLPFVLVLILNVCICIKIIPGFRQKSMRAGGESQAVHTTAHKDGKVTTMLVIVSLSWLILTGPFTLWSFVATQTRDPEEKAKDFLAKTICFLLMYVNHGINFYLYCVTGKKFRKELKEMIFGPRTHRGFGNSKSSFATMRTSLRNRSTATSHIDSMSGRTSSARFSLAKNTDELDTYN